MKKMGLVLLLAVMGMVVKAQQNHFVYIQTENKQAFYVKVDKKVFSSTGSGYVIIPKLTDGNYRFSIGFPKNEWPEQQISCKIDKKDAGYLLKNFGDKGWGLFNLQTMEVNMSGPDAGVIPVRSEENKSDAFSNILSNVAKDSSIRKQPVKQEAPVVPATPVVSEEVVRQPAASVVKRLLRNNAKAGMEMVYTVADGASVDTVRVFIPAGKESVVTKAEEPPVAITAPPVVDTVKTVAPSEKPKEKFIDMELPNPNSVTAPGQQGISPKDTIIEVKKVPDTPIDKPQVPVSGKPGAKMINSNCRDFAANDDFLKLRKKMAAAEAEDDMVAIAKKTFKTKCFTTEQIRNLGVLFLKDADRYNFFYAAYAWVSDSENYPGLQAQLTEEYYINLFKAMIRH